MFTKVLIANRGAIALRIMRTCRRLGIATVAVYSEVDAGAAFVQAADEALPLRGRRPAESYLDQEQIITAAKQAGVKAIHPGYGFLAENPRFAARCANEGLVFIGPQPEVMRQLGNKTAAKAMMAGLGIPTVPGVTEGIDDPALRAKAAEELGYPILIKAAAGGGGKGMRRVDDAADLSVSIDAARREAEAAFGDPTIFLEKYIAQPHHVEFQILGDAHGHVIHLYERDCSAQRRHQKIVEESPSPILTPDLRERMGAAAVTIAQAVGYQNAGTMEFLVDRERNFYFLEANTRLQVEHAVTEALCTIDLVEWQLRIAAGERLTVQQEAVTPRGHALECRIYAEDPDRDFLPMTGRIRCLREPRGDGVRLESGIYPGMEVSVDYDPMLAKLITWAPTRVESIQRMTRALHEYRIDGVTTNLDFLLDLIRSPAFVRGTVDTHYVPEFVSMRSPYRAPRGDPFSPWQQVTAAPGGWRLGGEREVTTITRAPKRIRGRRRLAPSGSLQAPMPGRVIKVLVAADESVEADQVLVIMEAMKMEYAIKAPAAGRVKAVHCQVGDLVDLGKQLVEVA